MTDDYFVNLHPGIRNLTYVTKNIETPIPPKFWKISLDGNIIIPSEKFGVAALLGNHTSKTGG